MIEPAEHPARILEVIIGWAKVHEDIRGVALVGSHARGAARLDSDIDLVVLADNPEAFRTDGSWIEAIDWPSAGVKVANWGDEDYGELWSRRVWLSSGAEVEISFAPVAWASIAPLDAGTRRVISDGCRILHDPAGSLGRLYEAVQSPLNPRTADAPVAVLQPVPVFDARGAICDDLLDISNAVALRWRLEQAGVDVGNRWEELADRAQGHLDDHLLVFGDVHYLMALAAAGRADDAACMVESMERYGAEGGETEAAVAGEPGLALAQGLLAHRRGDYARAIEELLPVRHTIRRIGGSHAQRDLFEGMLIDSVLRAGRFDQAKALLADRLQRRPRNAWGWRHYAQVLDRLGDGDGAATARATAERLIAA